MRKFSRWKARAIVSSATVAMACLGVTACSSSSNAGGGTTTLRVLLHSNPASDNFFKNTFTPMFEKKYPKVHVVLDLETTSNYFGIVKARMAAKAVDIVESPGAAPQSPPAYAKGSVEDPYVTEAKLGGYVDLSTQPFVSRLLPPIAKALPINGKTYAFPEGVTIVNGIYYNKTMFQKYGLAVPTTWSQFVADCQTLKTHGITPLAMGGKDVWPAGLVMLGMVGSLYPNLAALDKGLWTGTTKLNSPTAIQVMDRIKTIYSYTQPTFPGTAYATVDAQFTNGKVAMVPDGSWAETSIAAAKPTVDFGYFPLPGSDTASDNDLNSKVEAGLAVPSNSSAKQAALNFINLLSQPANYAKYTTATGFIPAESLGSAQSPFLSSIAPQIATMKTEWEAYFHVPANATDGTQYPFDYPDITPMGKMTDMTALANQMESRWNKARQG